MTITSPGSVLDAPSVRVRLGGRCTSPSSTDRSISTSPLIAALFRFSPVPALGFALLACTERAGTSSFSESSIVIVSVPDAGVLLEIVGSGADVVRGVGAGGAGLADALLLPLFTGGTLGRAYSSVQRLASLSCCARLRVYWVAMVGTGESKVSDRTSAEFLRG